MRDDEIYVLKSEVTPATSSVSFDFGLSQMLEGTEASLECLEIYAKPLSHKPYEASIGVEVERNWSFSLELEMLRSSSIIELSLGGSTGPVSAKTLLDRYKARTEDLKEGSFSYYQTLPELYVSDHDSSVNIEIPKNWSIMLKPPMLSEVFGLNGSANPLVSETPDPEHASSKWISTSPGVEVAHVSGRPLDLSALSQLPEGEDHVLFYVLLKYNSPTSSYEYSSPRPTGNLSLEKVSEWLSDGLIKTQIELNIKSLLKCSKNQKSIQIKSTYKKSENEEKAPPFWASLVLGSALKNDLHEKKSQFIFHFGLKPSKAKRLGALTEYDLRNWKATTSGEYVPWKDPLKAIAPFYLTSQNLDGSSFMSEKGFISILAYVGKSLHLSPRTAIRIKAMKENRVTLRFIDSNFDSCTFVAPFAIFMICKLS